MLRVVNGVPLFLNEHLSRFNYSAELAGREIRYSCTQIQSYLNQLIAKNEVNEGNILLSCKTNLKAFFISHKYPDARDYVRGVNCGLLFAERVNPNAKVFQTEVRKRANQLMTENNFYEVLLIDHLNRVTEGSRSNVFFIRNDEIFTPPGDKVLLGITRQKTIKCAEILNYRVNETEIYLNEISDFDAMFITGTSPKLLPVVQVEKVGYDVNNKLLRKLMKVYAQLIQEDIQVRRLGNKQG